MINLVNRIKELYSENIAGFLSELYGNDEAVIEKQQKRYEKAIRSFSEFFPTREEIKIYSAPGRTEIGGNHTDHQRGVVLAGAVNLDTLAVVAFHNDGVVRVKSEGYILAVKHLINGGESNIFNLGNGVGYSVKEVIETARKVTGHPIPAKEEPRRAGDPARLVASGEKAREILGWEPEIKDLADIISSAWKWHQTHPNGYDK